MPMVHRVFFLSATVVPVEPSIYCTLIICLIDDASKSKDMKINQNTKIVGQNVTIVPYRPVHVPKYMVRGLKVSI